MMTINAVFEGGGIRGIGHVGAIQATEAQFSTPAPDLYGNLAGTSAGAMIASLLACGYNGTELETIMRETSYPRFKDKDWLEGVPLVGPLLGALFEEGIHSGEYLRLWLQECYAKKTGKPELTFEDIKRPDGTYPLQVVASDITSGSMRVFPQDIVYYQEYTPDTLPVSLAVRMSASIPFYFRPIKLTSVATKKECFIVDGGLLSDYPLERVNRDQECTLGYKLVGPNDGKPNNIQGPISMVIALVNTMMAGHDNFYIDDHKFRNTIAIETFGVINGQPADIDGTNFDIITEELDLLYHNGQNAATKFFTKWNAASCGPILPVATGYSRHERLLP